MDEQQEREAWEAWVSKRSEHLRTNHNENIYRAGYEDARAALAAQGAPAGYAEMRSALLAVRTSIRFKSLSDEQRKLIDAALAATPAPAQAQQAAPERVHQLLAALTTNDDAHARARFAIELRSLYGVAPPQAQQAAVDHSMCPHQLAIDDWRLHNSGWPKP